MRLLDFHTHLRHIDRYRDDPDVTAVRSLMPDEVPDDRSDLFTIGIHPMDPAEYADPCALLEEKAASLGDRLLGIGECGWDRRSPHSPEKQTALVKEHVRLADRLGVPVVFHIVGGWHLLLALRKSHPDGLWVVHGFRGKPELLRQLRAAHIRVSLHPLYRWEAVPADPFFLETDDSDVPLSEVYRRAAEALKLPPEAAADRVLEAFRSLLRRG